MVRHTIYSLLMPLGAVIMLPGAARGQGGYVEKTGAYARPTHEDPGVLFLSAYRLCRESEELAMQQNYNAALKKGQEAERLLASIVRDFPNWRPNMVSTRRELLAENMSTYRQKAGQKPATPTGRMNPSELPPTYAPTYPTGVNDGGGRDEPLPNYHTTDRKLYNEIARLREELRRLAAEHRDTFQQLQDERKKLTSTQMELKMYRDRYERLQKHVEDERSVSNSYVDTLTRRIADMETKYRTAEASLQESEARAAELEKLLAEKQETLQQVTQERDQLRSENEQLRAIVELNSPEKTKALLDQNLTLAKQLSAAQEKIQELEAKQTGANDENEILTRQLEETRAEAARLRDELNALNDENAGYRKRISELTEQLNNLEADLATSAEQPRLDPALAEENNVLRGLIEKQRQKLAMQEESRKLLLETYKALKKDDPALMGVLKKLEEEGPQELTASERKILEDVRNGVTSESTDAVRKGLQMETLANLAEKAFEKGRYISAEQLYLTLYDMQPDHVAGLINLSTILLYNNKCEDAQQYLARATRLAPEMPIGHYLSGIAAYRLDDMNAALRCFTRTVQLDPGNAEAFFYLANIEAIGGHTDKALKHFAAAVKINPDLADAHYNMARLYAEDGKIPEAARSYDRAMHRGAEPDAEFELYLRRHPDNAKKPGADLVETVAPENEARDLGEAEPIEIVQASPAEESAETDKQEKPEDNFESLVEKTSAPVQAAPTPSPAASSHETAPERFSTIRMRTSSGSRTFRVKRAAPSRIRTRGEEKIDTLNAKG